MKKGRTNNEAQETAPQGESKRSTLRWPSRHAALTIAARCVGHRGTLRFSFASKINKACQFVLLLLCCSFAVPARGQKALDKTIRKNVELENTINSLKEDSAAWKKKISDIVLEISKDSVTVNRLESQYDSLSASISKDSIAWLRQEVKSLEERHQSLQSSIADLETNINENNKTLNDTNSELKDMSVYSEIQKEQSYEDNKQYLTRRYSEMTMDKLTEMSNGLEAYKAMADLSDYKNRVSAAISNKMIYDNAWDCICSGKNYQNVKDIRLGINSLLNIKQDNKSKGVYKLTKEQFNEIDTLDIKLSRLNNGIKELQKIVSRVIQIRNENGSKEQCIELVEQYISPKEGSEQYRISDRYFKMIPFLDNLLKDFWKELKENPFDTPTKSEGEITKLIVK